MGGTPQHGAFHALTIDLTVYYAVQPPDKTHTQAPALLLALHGWGQHCKRFLKAFQPLRDRNVLVAAPQAPHQFYVSLSPKKVGFNWLTLYHRDQGIADVNGYLARLLGVLQERYPYDPARIFLLGFSQGVSMAYRFAVSGGVQPAGLIACCSDLPPDVAKKLPSAVPFPVLLAYGADDTLVPEDKTHEAAAALAAHGFPFEEYRFAGGHEVTADLVAKVGGWMAAQAA